MSAVNPLPSSDVSADKRPYEPSMEEILASIRRIIADDQSLPGRGGAPREPETVAKDLRRPLPSSHPVERSVVTDPKADVRSDWAPVDHAPEAAPVEAETLAPSPLGPRRESGLAHGSIAAPQFAMPDGPVVNDQIREARKPALRLQPEPATAAVPEEPPPGAGSVSMKSPAVREQDEPLYDAPIEPESPHEEPQERPQLFSAATDSAVSAAFNMLAASRLADNSDELMTLAREMIRPLLRSWIDDHLPSMVERMVRAEIERVARGGR